VSVEPEETSEQSEGREFVISLGFLAERCGFASLGTFRSLGLDPFPGPWAAWSANDGLCSRRASRTKQKTIRIRAEKEEHL
jgi:hypothetical protein